MSVLVALARLLLAGVFVVSAVQKMRNRPGAREAVVAFGVPHVLVGLVAAGLPVVELACAALLLSADPAATIGAVASISLLLAFTVAIVVNLIRGRRPDCHCFGTMGKAGGISWLTVVRNGLLLGVAALSLVGAGGQASVPANLGALSPAEFGLLTGGCVLAAVLGATWLAVHTLMGRYGALLLRLETLEAAIGLAPAPPAPHFALPDLNGSLVTLDDVLDAGRPALLVFISPTCVNCAQLLPDLASWQSDPDHALTVVIISDGSVADNLAKIADVGPLRVLLQEGFATASAYKMQGTPGAVLVGVDGRQAGQAAHALDGVRSLHDTTVRVIGGELVQPAAQQPLHRIGPRPVSPGDPFPEVVLVSESGAAVDGSEIVGDEAVLLFWRTSCSFCAGIVDQVRALEAHVPVRLITASELVDVRASGLISPVMRDPSGVLESWLRVPGTPAAARVRGRALDSAVAVGGPDVLALLRASTRSSATAD